MPLLVPNCILRDLAEDMRGRAILLRPSDVEADWPCTVRVAPGCTACRLVLEALELAVLVPLPDEAPLPLVCGNFIKLDGMLDELYTLVGQKGC